MAVVAVSGKFNIERSIIKERMDIIMKKIFLFTILGLAVTVPCGAFAYDAGPASTPEMRRIQQSSFERFAPEQIQRSYERKDAAEASDKSAEQQINRRIEEIEQVGSLSGQVENRKIYVTVNQVVFPKSEVFTETELQKFAAPLIGRTVTIDEINKVIESISKAYVGSDYFTSRAYLPEQTVNDGILRIALYEGRVGKINVENNKWTRSSYITNRIDTKEGDLFKLRALEKQVITFNNNNDVKLNVKIKPGEEVGTTDVDIKTDDKFPFHITGVFDNMGRENIGVLRGGAIISSDSLFGIRDKFAGGAYFGKHSQVAFADYNAPINSKGTRLGGSFSYNHVSIKNGPFKDFGIKGKTFAYTGYVSHPIIQKPNMSLNSYTAGNIKLTSTDVSDITLFKTRTYSGTQGFNARWDTPKGIWLTGHYGTVGYFDSDGNNDVFFKYEGNGVRLHDFGHGIIGEFRVAGQWSPTDKLPWIEQYQTGGMSSIRGYSEGVLIGRSGYSTNAELITPIPFLPKRIGGEKIGYIHPREMVKFAVFVDHGGIFSDTSGGLPSSQFLVGTGAGLRINMSDEIMARLYWGFGLVNTAYELKDKSCRFHFELATRPDLTRLIRDKNNKESL